MLTLSDAWNSNTAHCVVIITQVVTVCKFYNAILLNKVKMNTAAHTRPVLCCLQK